MKRLGLVQQWTCGRHSITLLFPLEPISALFAHMLNDSTNFTMINPLILKSFLQSYHLSLPHIRPVSAFCTFCSHMLISESYLCFPIIVISNLSSQQIQLQICLVKILHLEKIQVLLPYNYICWNSIVLHKWKPLVLQLELDGMPNFHCSTNPAAYYSPYMVE